MSVGGLADDFVVTNDLSHDESEKFLGEFGVKVSFLGEPPQSGDLLGLARRIGGREFVPRFQQPTSRVHLKRSASM